MHRAVVCFAIAACGYPQPLRASDAGADGPRDGAVPDAVHDGPADTAGGPACSIKLTCTTPANGTQTVCGQLYDLATNAPFAANSPTGGACGGSATAGPCALQLAAYDAIQYLQAPGATTPLPIGSTYLDDCGRFELQDISPPSGPFVMVVVDDRNAAGPSGTTNTVAIAVATAANTVTNGVEHWIASSATTDAWATTGAPPVSSGLYVPIFRAHVATSSDLFTSQAGVAMTRSGTAIVTGMTYFVQTATTRMAIDPNATVTGASGSGILATASITDGAVYSGTGGLTDTINCKWETHSAAVVANVVFAQVYRPVSQITKTCTE